MTRRSLVTLLAFVAFVSLGLPDALLGVAWPSISTTFAVPLDALGVVFGMSVTGYLLSSFSSGAILRIVPLGTVLTVSTATASLSLLLLAGAPSWPFVITSAFLAGLGGGAVDAGLNAYGAANFSPRIMNWLHASFGLGTTLGPLIVTGVLGSGLAWQWSYGLVGAAQALLAVTFLLTRSRWRPVGDDGGRDDGAASEPVSAASSAQTLRRPVVWLGMLVFSLYVGAEMATALWSYSVLTLGRGVADTAAGLAVTAYWGSLMAGRVLFGIVADTVRLVPALRLAIALSILGALAFWLAPSLPLALAGLLMMGFGFAPVFASLVSLTPDRVGRAHADSAIGFQIASAGLGAAVISGLVGIAADEAGLGIVGPSLLALTLALYIAFEAFVRR